MAVGEKKKSKVGQGPRYVLYAKTNKAGPSKLTLFSLFLSLLQKNAPRREILSQCLAGAVGFQEETRLQHL